MQLNHEDLLLNLDVIECVIGLFESGAYVGIGQSEKLHFYVIGRKSRSGEDCQIMIGLFGTVVHVNGKRFLSFHWSIFYIIKCYLFLCFRNMKINRILCKLSTSFLAFVTRNCSLKLDNSVREIVYVNDMNVNGISYEALNFSVK